MAGKRTRQKSEKQKKKLGQWSSIVFVYSIGQLRLFVYLLFEIV